MSTINAAMSETSEKKVPSELSEKKVPSEISEKKVPSELSEKKVPSEFSEQKVPSQLSEKKAPSQLSEKKAPSQISEKKLPIDLECNDKVALMELECCSRMEAEFFGKRILVTGTGQGIGRALAKELASYGAEVVAFSRTNSYLETLKTESPSITTVCVDVGEWDQTRQLVTENGPFQYLVNNAAVSGWGSFLKTTRESFDEVLNVNLKAVLNISQVVAGQMIETGTGGSIVNISSRAAKRAIRDHASYCASKAAMDHLSRVMALELGPHNIRVNCVNPTVVNTNLGQYVLSDPVKAKAWLDSIPLGRVVEVQEVVDTVIFLLSKRASMITGVSLSIDGGLTV